MKKEVVKKIKLKFEPNLKDYKKTYQKFQWKNCPLSEKFSSEGYGEIALNMHANG